MALPQSIELLIEQPDGFMSWAAYALTGAEKPTSLSAAMAKLASILQKCSKYSNGMVTRSEIAGVLLERKLAKASDALAEADMLLNYGRFGDWVFVPCYDGRGDKSKPSGYRLTTVQLLEEPLRDLPWLTQAPATAYLFFFNLPPHL